jgi:hypothetical protein
MNTTEATDIDTLLTSAKVGETAGIVLMNILLTAAILTKMLPLTLAAIARASTLPVKAVP